jgi:hypothetical protein
MRRLTAVLAVLAALGLAAAPTAGTKEPCTDPDPTVCPDKKPKKPKKDKDPPPPPPELI